MTPKETANSLEAMMARRDAYGGSHAPLMEGEKYAIREAVRMLRELGPSCTPEFLDYLEKSRQRAADKPDARHSVDCQVQQDGDAPCTCGARAAFTTPE